MYAIMERFTEPTRLRALELFVNGTVRVSPSWRTVRLLRLGLDMYTGADGVGLAGFGREFTICPLGALWFARWGGEGLATFEDEERARLGQTNPTVKTTLDKLLYPHPDMLARRLLDLTFAQATHLIDHRLQGYERIVGLGRAALEVERDYDAGKLDRPEDLYAAFGVAWPADAFVEIYPDGGCRVRRFDATSASAVDLELTISDATLAAPVGA
jgi:hypothetical protein